MGNKMFYSGSFDLPTRGHLWLMQEGRKLCDELIIGIGINQEKERMFTQEQSIEMLEAMTAGIDNISIMTFAGALTVDIAKEVGADFILRGIRNEEDFAYEKRFVDINKKIAANITTLFLMPPIELSIVSSSVAREVWKSGGGTDALTEFVHPDVVKLVEKYTQK